MVTQVKALPSAIDFDTFQLVYVEQRGAEQVAEALRISVAQVKQKVSLVRAYLLDQMPATESEEETARRLQISRQVAAERIDFLYGEAVRCFERSRSVQTTTREIAGQSHSAVTIHRKSNGEARYLAVAARLAILAAKLPASILSEAVLHEDEGNRVAKRAPQSGTAKPTPSHPKEDCSASPAEQAPTPVSEAVKKDASNSLVIACVNEILANQALKTSAPAPAQSVNSAGNGRPLNLRQQQARSAFLEAS